MLEILNKIKEQYQKLTEELSNPQVFSDQNRYKKISKEHAHLSQIMELSREYENILKLMGEAEEVKNSSTDKELLELAKEELAELYPKKEKLEDDLKKMLIPKDPQDDKSSIVEIRAGTGGEEAALFAADLYRMYVKYAEKQGWKVELLSSNPTGVGGFKEVIFSVEGQGAYGNLKYESGVHRVQRVPKTEASGRIHTSASSVAVLPEAEEVDIEIKPEDLRIDVFRSSGPGGQSVNTTDSAVRVTHLPTNTVVTCQDEKSQLKNKTKALKVLRARLLDKALIDQKQKVDQERKSMVGTGDRSAKIRTYNFPQGRVTDHRIGLTLHQLEDVLAGELDEFIQAFKQKEQEQKLSLKEKVNQNEA